MRKGVGIACIMLGIACLLSSLGLVIYNRMEADAAEVTSRALLQDVQKRIVHPTVPQPSREEESVPELPEETIPEIQPQEMRSVPLENDDCIGILSIPVLEIELPVLTDWSYAKLKKAPCHYYGSCYDTDFVIAAHNYAAHFGRLTELRQGDLVLFTDTGGTTHSYEVVLRETLPPTATEEMITSGFDLSLYTCTPGGANRVTVRCNKVND